MVQLTDTGRAPLLKQYVSNVEFSVTERFLSAGFRCGGPRKKNIRKKTIRLSLQVHWYVDLEKVNQNYEKMSYAIQILF